jgi:hypothetical protein
MLSQKLTEKGISNKVLSFAEPLKKITEKIKGGTLDWENRQVKENNRSTLHNLANAIKDFFSFNPFSSELLGKIATESLINNTKVTVISDLRFEDEYCSLWNWFSEEPKDELIVIEITNPLTDNNPPEYDLEAIPSNKIINFDSSLENQINQLIQELL